jgi:maltooligosyltrehalose synthase
LAFYREATSLRRRYPVLRTGSFRSVHAAGEVYAFCRQLEQQTAVVIFNVATTPTRLKLTLPEVRIDTLTQVWPSGVEQSFGVSEGQLEVRLPRREALVLLAEDS